MKNSSGEVIVDFCFRSAQGKAIKNRQPLRAFLKRAGRIILAGGALAFIPSFVTAPCAHAQDQKPQPNWKDRDEYDAFQKVQTTTDPKGRLDALKAWEDKYPTSEFVAMRNQYYLDTLSRLASSDPSQRQALLNKAQDVLKTDPKNANAQYLIALWGPIVGGASPSPDLAGQVESAAHAFIGDSDQAFADANKPPNMSAADWTKVKVSRVALAHNALAWAAASKKDFPTAESEYKESLTVNPDSGQTSALYARMLYEEKDDKKYPEALFQYARTAQYSGPGPAQSATGRQQALDFFNKLYKTYHGSDEGKDQVLAEAKTSALPPAGFTISSIAAKMAADADATNARIKADPSFALWYSLKVNLTGDQGPAFFTNSVKDYELPGGANGVKNFSGTILTVEPADKPTRVTLGIEDPTKADATLLFTTPIPTAALSKIKVGEKIEFSAEADSYTKDPYMLTFKDPEIPGVELAPVVRKPGRKKK
jgi:tetratricopeptide (TPR) repeat protein